MSRNPVGDESYSTSRRHVLGLVSSAIVGGIAGCGGDGDGDDTPTDTDAGGNGNGNGNGDTATETEPPTETETPTDTATPTDTQEEELLGSEPSTLISLNDVSVSVGSTTTLNTSLSNPYLFDVRSVEVELEVDAPEDAVTVSPTGDTSFETVPPGKPQELGWEITASDSADGEYPMIATVSYESATDQAERTISQTLTVFDPGEVPGDGLQAYFPLDGDPPTDAVSGEEATIGGDPDTDAEGTVDGAYDFDGDGDYLELPEFGSDNDSLSVALWVNAREWTADRDQLVFWGGPVPNHTGVEFWTEEGGSSPGFFYYDDGFNGIQAVSDTSLPTEEWVHLCGVYDDDSGTWTLYVNGDPVENVSDSTNIAFDPVDTRLCTHPQEDLDRFIDGRVDEARFYDRALAEGEVQAFVA